MVKVKCYHCHGENPVRNGKTNNGKQRYLCRTCGKMSRDNRQPNGYSAEEREQILRDYQERAILRGLTRTFGVARNTVGSEKKTRDAGIKRNIGVPDGSANFRTRRVMVICFEESPQAMDLDCPVSANPARSLLLSAVSVPHKLAADYGRKFPKHFGKPLAFLTFEKHIN